MVAVAQLVEHSVVVRAVEGSSPFGHPKIRSEASIFLACARMGAQKNWGLTPIPNTILQRLHEKQLIIQRFHEILILQDDYNNFLLWTHSRAYYNIPISRKIPHIKGLFVFSVFHGRIAKIAIVSQVCVREQSVTLYRTFLIVARIRRIKSVLFVSFLEFI